MNDTNRGATQKGRNRGQALGRDGEDTVARMLTAAGWTVLGRNVRDGPRELDVVARLGPLVAFVEVKSRAQSVASALESIGWKKKRHLARAARAWIRVHGRPGDFYRFDVVAVVGEAGQPATVEWVEDAWRIE